MAHSDWAGPCSEKNTCSAIYEISMELHQLREVAPASPRSSLSISLEIVRSCCISMGISGTVRCHESRDFAIGYFKRGYTLIVALCDTTSADKIVKPCELSVLRLVSPWVDAHENHVRLAQHTQEEAPFDSSYGPRSADGPMWPRTEGKPEP